MKSGIACLVFVILVVAVTQSAGNRISSKADSYIGSTVWSKAGSRKVGSGQWKCNIFVAEVLESAGASLPHRRWWKWTPIGANEWANPSSSYLSGDRCWTRVTSPTNGDVAAYGGHVGFVTGSRTTTSAAEYQVVKNDWGFRAGQGTVFWRYTC